MPQDQVEEIKSKVDIVDIIGERVKLTKAGSNYKGLCPFHEEHTPSFMVTPELQIFKCFGCGEGGDVISFIEKYEGLEFYEALEMLADRVGVKLIKKNAGVKSEKQLLYSINNQARRFYQYILLKHPTGKKALEYLLKERGVDKETINAFGLGFAPEKASVMPDFLIKKGIKSTELEKAGLVYMRGRQAYDRFAGRVIFPLNDHRGNVVGFAGRLLPGGREDRAKYINTPETAVYKKSEVLYGYDLVKQDIKKAGYAVIVEGELDMISSWQAGIKNTVAIKGSALTQMQVRLIKRITPRVVLALDSDFAGDAAAKKGLSVAQEEGLEVRVALLTKYKDPDDAARANPEYLKEMIESAVNVWDFIINSAFKRHGKGGAAKASISRELVPVLASIKDSIVQAHYVGIVAQKLEIEEEAVAREVEKYLSKNPDDISAKAAEINMPYLKKLHDNKESWLMALILQSDKSYLKDALEFLSEPVDIKLAEKVLAITEESNPGAKEIEKRLPGELKEAYGNYMVMDLFELAKSEEKAIKEIEIALKNFKIADIKQKREKMLKEIKSLETGKEKEKLGKVMQEYDRLTKKLSQLTA